MMLRTPLKDRARGRWKSIIPSLGLADVRTLSGKHGPCPFCGGKDRFRFDDKDGAGSFICSHCGAGDGIGFVMRCTGLDFRGAAERIEGVIGSAPAIERKAQRSEQQNKAAMNALWGQGRAVEAGDVVSRFHIARGIRLGSYPPCLRTCDRARYQDGDAASFHPAMLAMVRASDGRPVNVHRTFLSLDGRKADVASPRKPMPGTIPKGSAVQIAPARDVLGIAEGIETALAASILFDVPVWAALNAGNMRGWLPPAGVKRVIVFGDNDANLVGQRAAYDLAASLHKAGVEADVKVPDRAGDWNDELLKDQERRRGSRCP